LCADEQKNETLMIYGFSFAYHPSAKIEFNPKFSRLAGDVAIKFLGEYNTFVSWGDLEKLKRKLPSVEEHARYSIENVSKRFQGRVTGIEKTQVSVNGHAAEYNHVRIDIPKRGLFGGRQQVQEMHSLHIHCPESLRYFVIYGSSGPEKAESQGRMVATFIQSFKCH
jgi:hypothetical protein